MKKSLFLTAALATALWLPAQNLDTFEFVDANGNTLPDGTELTITEVTSEEDYGTGEIINYMYANVSVHNLLDIDQAMRINMIIDRLDNGAYQMCFPQACRFYTAVGNFVTDGGVMMPNETRSLLTEWMPLDEGSCDVILTIELLDVGGTAISPTYTYVDDGATIVLHYRNGTAEVLKGDVDGNGKVEVDDMSIVIDILLNKTTLDEYPAADVNVDGKVSIDDMNEVINIILHKD